MDSRDPAPPVNSTTVRRKDPLRHRRYLHFDERPPRDHLVSRVGDPARVAQWQFLPLLRKMERSKRVRDKDPLTGLFSVKEKIRPICYASHQDAALYATYAAKLSELYEQKLKELGLNDCVTAFREASGKCNIHFALDAFEWIQTHAPCVALAYDVTSFFDELDHCHLKAKWCELLAVTSLPADHHALYRAITRFSVVDRDLVYKTFSISQHTPYAFGRRRICSPAEFRQHVADAGLLESNKKQYGIPQGTPISAVLSNLYMLDFDRELAATVSAWGGLYRRYCDDILVVVPPHYCDEAKALVEREIAKAKLRVQREKLDERFFPGSSSRLAKPLQYLGLTFDGERILLRSSGIARFYTRMRAGVRREDAVRHKNARASGQSPTAVQINRKRLNAAYTYVGRRNFVSYAHRAARITGQNAIKRQVSPHWMKLGAAIAKANAAIEEN